MQPFAEKEEWMPEKQRKHEEGAVRVHGGGAGRGMGSLG